MRRNVVENLKHQHMQEFKRKTVEAILKERENLPGYSSPLQKHKNSGDNVPSTADASPASKVTVQEKEVRKNFTNYMSEIVSKNGEGGSKKDKSFEAMQKRAMLAIEGAKKHKTKFGNNVKSKNQE